jgi:hypothetical protein
VNAYRALGVGAFFYPATAFPHSPELSPQVIPILLKLRERGPLGRKALLRDLPLISATSAYLLHTP